MQSETIVKLVENYANLEKTLIQELEIDGNSEVSSAEEIWQPVFKRIVPTKYNIEKNVYIIDSHQKESNKVSLAIYDEQYTPYIFNYGTIKYIPIEAVFAVVHCENENNRESSKKWLEKIQALQTDMNAYVRIQSDLLDTNFDTLYEDFIKQKEEFDKGRTKKSPFKQTQTSTRPVTILCTTAKSKDDSACFDIKLLITDEKLKKEIDNSKQTLADWYESLNHYVRKPVDEGEKEKENKVDALKKESETNRKLKDLEVKRGYKEQVLLSFMFQLNQLLMLINNPMFFPHASYVQAFNKKG